MEDTVVQRVPVDRRLLGIDRRSIAFAVPILVVWVLAVVVLPWIDDQVDWDDPVVAGDQLRVTRTVSMTPPVGWNVESGVRVDEDSVVADDTPPAVTLTQGGVTVTMRAGDWDGTSEKLLTQITKVTTTMGGGESIQVTAQTHTIRTDQGAPGVAEGYTSPRVTGVIAAFVFGDKGVEIQVTGTVEEMSRRSEEITAMVASLNDTADGDDTTEASS